MLIRYRWNPVYTRFEIFTEGNFDYNYKWWASAFSSREEIENVWAPGKVKFVTWNATWCEPINGDYEK